MLCVTLRVANPVMQYIGDGSLLAIEPIMCSTGATRRSCGSLESAKLIMYGSCSRGPIRGLGGHRSPY